MLEHMHKTLIEQKGKHGMDYGYFLTRVFKCMEIPLEAGVRGTIKQSFSMNTFVECECMEGNTRYMSKMTELVVEQSQLRHELEEMTALLSHKDAKIVVLKAQLVNAQTEGPGSTEVAEVMAKNESLVT
uniref:Putative ovule protein n=1 Tax=Solanum chacoense TaxID=4108 RepID=A0A0V0HDX3_SOLCH